MHPSQRREEIISLLSQAGEMSVEELASRLDVSKETIRRDLTHLDASGGLKKFHGGARVVAVADAEKEGPFAQRMAQNFEAKKRIAEAACRLLQPGDSIFIDTGSTTIALAEALLKLNGLVIITNEPRIAAIVAANATHKVFLLGGAYSADAGESVGPLALEQVAKFRAGHALLTVGAIDTASIMDFDLHEAEMAKAMIERADQVTVLVDHSKFEHRAVFEVAPLSKIRNVVTDRKPGEPIAAALAEAGVSLIVAGE
jgi:DeoR family glycerol-3-phosphate regulon repressor